MVVNSFLSILIFPELISTFQVRLEEQEWKAWGANQGSRGRCSGAVALPFCCCCSWTGAQGEPQSLLLCFSFGLQLSGVQARQGSAVAAGRFRLSTPAPWHPYQLFPAGQEELEGGTYPPPLPLTQAWEEPQSWFCPVPAIHCRQQLHRDLDSARDNGSIEVLLSSKPHPPLVNPRSTHESHVAYKYRHRAKASCGLVSYASNLKQKVDVHVAGSTIVYIGTLNVQVLHAAYNNRTLDDWQYVRIAS